MRRQSCGLGGLFLFAVLCMGATLAQAQADPSKIASPAGQTEYLAGAQLRMQNNSSVTLDFYVDGAYVGTALKNLGFNTQVDPGSHNLEARAADGRKAFGTITVAEGGTATWTVGN